MLRRRPTSTLVPYPTPFRSHVTFSTIHKMRNISRTNADRDKIAKATNRKPSIADTIHIIHMSLGEHVTRFHVTCPFPEYTKCGISREPMLIETKLQKLLIGNPVSPTRSTLYI